MTKVIRMIEAISRRHFSNMFRKDLRFETLFWSVIGYSIISRSSISVDILKICFSHTAFDLCQFNTTLNVNRKKLVVVSWREEALGHKCKCSIFSDICSLYNQTLQLDGVSFIKILKLRLFPQQKVIHR